MPSVSKPKATATDSRLYQKFSAIVADVMPPRDAAEHTPAQLKGLTRSLWDFAQNRKTGETKLQVVNPVRDADGWISPYTIIHIITDDMPYLVNSIWMALQRLGSTIELSLHPMMRIARDSKGNLTDVNGVNDKTNAPVEALFALEINRHNQPQQLEQIANVLEGVLNDIRIAVDSRPAITARLQQTLQNLNPQAADYQESQKFLDWLREDNFIFLGARDYKLSLKNERLVGSIVKGNGLGLLADDQKIFGEETMIMQGLSPQVTKNVGKRQTIYIVKSAGTSTIERAAHFDRITVRDFDEQGRLTHARMFLGLFTPRAYGQYVETIPLIGSKVTQVLAKSGKVADAHDYKALQQILNSYPRDELFNMSPQDLLSNALGILNLQERTRTALFVRRDPYERLISCLIYTLRDSYSTALLRRIRRKLAKAFNGIDEVSLINIDDSHFVRLQILINKRDDAPLAYPDLNELEADLIKMCQSWSDGLKHALEREPDCCNDNFPAFVERYGSAFPLSYQESVSPDDAVADIKALDILMTAQQDRLVRFHLSSASAPRLHVKFYARGARPQLNDILPLIENIGLLVEEENTYALQFSDSDETIWLSDFIVKADDATRADILARAGDLETAIDRILGQELSDDRFNHLLLSARLNWREVWLLRACSRYLLQARLPYSQRYVTDTLDKHASVAHQLIELFHLRFNPDTKAKGRDAAITTLTAQIEDYLTKIASSDEDYILRRLLNVVQCMLRTNFFQRNADGTSKAYVSFKLDSQKLMDLPAPRPLYEVYVYSTRVEAIHLRSSKIARGGIRWSDRREDYRDEILGLMKAQTVKNSVIVPTGAKGGFYVKLPPADPKARQAEGIECYKTLIRGLLDITDNWSPNGIIKPANVVCYDDDDIYLVVAADKGTASFSDIANGISADYNFWLGDAFASGGSAGYDHKKMGITARGAWESIMRHFHELGKDIQQEDFTVVGVGDMGGDVFGNGMLLSPHIKLLGAVNYKSIFVDPDPDPAVSFKERQRLFDNVQAWEHYDSKLISKGGGVFDRNAKQIPVSPEMRTAFGLDKNSVTPNELIRAILKANAELLWFGGIGTYIRADDETDSDVRDKGNDVLRVTAGELRCKVIGEGANLGMTQRSRIAAAERGILLNTDFIDNSAGVNCSDYEVNIKILLNSVMRESNMTLAQRNKLLASMTDEVAELVLDNNRAQTLAISIATYMSPVRVEHVQRYIQDLEAAGALDRALEFLPDDAALAVRARDRKGITRPEMAVIISYAKLSLTKSLMKTDVPELSELDGMLLHYFPKTLAKRFTDDILNHRLHKNLKAMLLANRMINRLGPLLIKWLTDRTGQEYTDIVRAFLICAEIFEFDAIWHDIENLKGKIKASLQYDLFIDLIQLMDRVMPAVLAQPKYLADIPAAIQHFAKPYAMLVRDIAKTLPPERKKVHDWHIKTLRDQGVPAALALRISDLRSLSSAFSIIHVADETKQPALRAAEVFFAVGEHLSLDWLREQARQAKATDYWERQAYATLLEDFIAHQERLTIQILQKKSSKGDAIAAWTATHPTVMKRLQRLASDLRAASQISVTQLMVANRRLRGYIPARR